MADELATRQMAENKGFVHDGGIYSVGSKEILTLNDFQSQVMVPLSLNLPGSYTAGECLADKDIVLPNEDAFNLNLVIKEAKMRIYTEGGTPWRTLLLNYPTAPQTALVYLTANNLEAIPTYTGSVYVRVEIEVAFELRTVIGNRLHIPTGLSYISWEPNANAGVSHNAVGVNTSVALSNNTMNNTVHMHFATHFYASSVRGEVIKINADTDIMTLRAYNIDGDKNIKFYINNV